MAVEYNSYANNAVVPKLPSYQTPYQSNKYDPKAYYTQALGFLPIDTRYLVNTTNRKAYNSMADVLFNTAAWDARWDNSEHSWLNEWWAYIPRVVADTGLLIKDTVYDPIAAGIEEDGWDGFLRGSSTALMNSLVNLGNTLDILSNPIKGAIIEGFTPGGKGAFEGAWNGLFGDEEGRKQYDYSDYIDTGDGVLDFALSMGLEIISDPLNWVSFGGKQVIKSGADEISTAATKSIKEALENSLKNNVKHVDDLVPTIKTAVPYFTDDTAKAFLNQMADESGNVIKSAIDPTLDTFQVGLKKGIQRAANKGGNEAALKAVASDLTTGKITRMKAGMLDIVPVKLSAASQMGVSDYLQYASKNLPDLFSTGKIGTGLKFIKTSDTIQKGLFNVAGLTGLDWFVGGNKIIKRVSDNLKISHAKNSKTIIHDVTELADELRIDVESLDIENFPGLDEIKLKHLAGTDHSGIASKLNDLKDKFTAKIIDARKTHTLTRDTYLQIREEILKEIDDVIATGTKNISNLKNLDEYLNFFTELRSVSKTELKELDNIIDQITAYKDLFTRTINKNTFTDIIHTIYQYEKALDEVFTQTQMENIAKAAEPVADTYSKIKGVKEAEREMFETMKEQADRVLVRDEQIANSIKYITEQHDKITETVKPITNAYFEQAPGSSAVVAFTKDYEAYRDTYEAYFDMLHSGTETTGSLQKAQTDLIDAYNRLVESYEVNALSTLRQAQQAATTKAAAATLADVQSFIKSLQAQNIDEVDELINLKHYVDAGLISYTLMTQQTKYMTDLIGLTLDGSRSATPGALGSLMQAYHPRSPLAKLLDDTGVPADSIKGQRFKAVRDLLDRQYYFKSACEELGAMCSRAGIDAGHRQGLIDALVTELQRGTLNSATDFHNMAERMLKSADIYFANHLVDKSFAMDNVLHDIATEIFNKTTSKETRTVAKEILSSLSNAHDGAVDVDNWLRFLNIAEESDNAVIKGITEKFKTAVKGKRVVVFDLETLGTKEFYNAPYQIAGKVVDDAGNVIETFNIYIKPASNVRPTNTVLRKLAPATVASDAESLQKWWDNMWQSGELAAKGVVVDSADQGVRMFQDICSKYSDQGLVFAGQNIKSFDLDVLAKYAGSDFKDFMKQAAKFDSLEYLSSSSYFNLTGGMRTIFIGQLEEVLKNKLINLAVDFCNTKLFSTSDITALKELRYYLTEDVATKHLTTYIDDIVKGWYSPPDFNATKYFTVSKIDPKTYTKSMKAYMDSLVTQGLLNVTSTSNIQHFLNKGVAFDTVQLNFKTAVSKEFANVFSLKKMPTSIVSRQVAEEITLHARSILNTRIALTNNMIDKLLPDARKVIQILQDDAKLIELGINIDNNLCTYAKWLYDEADSAMVVATALYYADRLPGLHSLLPQDVPTILRLKEIDELTNLPKFIFEEDYYNYDELIDVIQSNDPFKLIKAYNTERNIYNIHEAAIHRMQADNVRLFKSVEDLLARESGGKLKVRKFLERAIYKYTDYLDEQAIKEILNPADGVSRVKKFIDDAQLRAGRVYFETRNAIDLSDFANTEGVIAKSVEIFDNNTGKSLGYAHTICLTKETYGKAGEVTQGIKMVDGVPNISSEMHQLIKENRYHNGLYVKNIGWSHGDILTEQYIRGFDEMLQTRFGIDASELVDLNTLNAQKYFDTLRANNMIIGGRDTFNRVLGNTDIKYVADPFKLTFYNTRGAVTVKQTRLASYLNLFFNKENRIDSQWFKSLSNAELYKLAKQHKEGFGFYYIEEPHIKEGSFISKFFSDRTESGYVMREIPIINEKSVQVARDIQAYCLPRTQAAQMLQAINTFQLPPIAKAAQFISTLYKLAYLGSVGVVIRNCIDSNYKTRWALDGTVSLPDQVKHLFSTMKLIDKYNDIGKLYTSVTQDYFGTNLDYELFYKTIKNLNVDDVAVKIAADYSDEMSDVVTRKVNNILKQFSNNMDDLANLESKLIDPDMFSVMDSFIRFGPSAGLSKSITNNFLSRTDDAVSNKILSWITEKSPARFVYNMNDMVEQSARLSMFLQDVSRGSTVDDAISNIIKTHFDYSDKTLGMLYTEIIFPFMNFSYKNLNFWIESIYKNPAMVGELENIFRTIMDYQSLFEEDQEAYSAYDYTFDWHEHITSFKANAPWTTINAARLYHILNGNIVIDANKEVKHNNDYGTKTNDLYHVFKLSPSVLDATKMLYNPLNSYSERILPPYEALSNAMLNALNGKSSADQISVTSFANMLPYVDVVMQRIGINEKGLKHNNIFKRVEDNGPLQLVGSLFGTAYVPRKDKTYYYDSDYNVLGGFKQNYYAKRNYSNPYNSKYPSYTLTRMAQNKKPRNIYAKSKTYRLNTYQYNTYARNVSNNILRHRLKDYYYYY
jgi:hypothetical protein